ncbi:uncharacterized protein LOC124915305 [Impatiens glandulifera]|uniref:uncharacterized protein LOC124915305 n=1 Tax=Impatiens glandulifera TaxID=253017 RepID=UPI001FB17207|nr:uncharacterized protein LOC124915305 [Impatiens glandulifera]
MAISPTPVSQQEPSCSNLPQEHASLQSPADALEKKKKRNQSPGVRVIGARIYDSQNGKTCHQCRQKTMDIMAPCKNHKKEKQCTIKYCHKCLLNRYGEKAEEVAVLEDWFCPKCKGICNCSFCRKKLGQQPTGILSYTAKSTGFASVSEMLLVKGPDVQSAKKSTHDNPKKGKENLNENSDMNLVEQKAKKVKKGNMLEEKDKKDDKEMDHGVIISKKRKKNINTDMEGMSDVPDAKKLKVEGQVETNPICSLSDGVIISKKRKKKINTDMEGKSDVPDAKKLKVKGQVETNSICSLSDVEIPLPQGSEMRTVAGIELQPKEVGHALQFLEFCAAFGEILELKKDEPEYILYELIRGGSGCIGRSSPVAQFFVRLLSLIQTDSADSSIVLTHKLSHKTSWMLALHKCISGSTYLSGKLKLDQLDGGVDSYKSLNSTERLTLVNFVCDEVLCTNKVRNWIDEQKLKCSENVKETKEKVVAAKNKEKQLKQKMHSELAEAMISKNGVPLSISEQTAIVSQIKVQIAQAHAEMLESKEMLCIEKQQCISVRTKPILEDNGGRTFWRLKGCGAESNILLQEASLPDESEFHETWFTYEEEEQADKIKKYISSKGKVKKEHKRFKPKLIIL